MNRVYNGIRPETGQGHCGFVKNTGTENTISEWAIQIQKGLYLCFIDYGEAFDKHLWKGYYNNPDCPVSDV